MGNEKNEVKFKRLSWDSEFYLDLITGNGFEITNPSEVSIDGVRRKALYGSQSPLYGTTYDIILFINKIGTSFLMVLLHIDDIAIP